MRGCSANLGNCPAPAATGVSSHHHHQHHLPWRASPPPPSESRNPIPCFPILRLPSEITIQINATINTQLTSSPHQKLPHPKSTVYLNECIPSLKTPHCVSAGMPVIFPTLTLGSVVLVLPSDDYRKLVPGAFFPIVQCPRDPAFFKHRGLREESLGRLEGEFANRPFDKNVPFLLVTVRTN